MMSGFSHMPLSGVPSGPYKVLTTTQPPYLQHLIFVQPPRSASSSSHSTHCQNVYAAPLLVLLFLAVFWKYSSSQSTSVSNALEALAMMRYINLRFKLHYITLRLWLPSLDHQHHPRYVSLLRYASLISGINFLVLSGNLISALCLCPACSCSYHISLCQLTTLTIHNSVSLSLPAQDLPLPQIFPTIGSIPASGLSPRTSWPYHSSEHLCFLWPPYGIWQAIIFLPCGFFLYGRPM